MYPRIEIVSTQGVFLHDIFVLQRANIAPASPSKKIRIIRVRCIRHEKLINSQRLVLLATAKVTAKLYP